MLDVAATVKALREKGVVFETYPHFNQDEMGIWIAPGGVIRVAWLFVTLSTLRSGSLTVQLSGS